MQKWEIKQMGPIKMAIYKKFTRQSTIDLIFATLLLSESLIYYKIAENFDYNLNYQLILFE